MNAQWAALRRKLRRIGSALLEWRQDQCRADAQVTKKAGT